MNMVLPLPVKVSVHAVWLSDIHLGYKDCKAKYLLDFLDHIETKYLYLVGDIVDVWSLSRQFHWPAEHSQVVRKLIKMAKEGVNITYVPGNHDSTFREYCGEAFGAIQMARQTLHVTQLGKRMLVTHGDEFDELIRFSRFISIIGDTAYDFLLFVTRYNNYFRKQFGYGYWSLATHIKGRLANAKQAISLFETAALDRAKREGYDGIVCGHIHHPNVVERDGVIYCNDGDWVESCTTLVEKNDGVLELWHWSDRSQCIKRLTGEKINADVEQLDLLQTA